MSDRTEEGGKTPPPSSSPPTFKGTMDLDLSQLMRPLPSVEGLDIDLTFQQAVLGWIAAPLVPPDDDDAKAFASMTDDEIDAALLRAIVETGNARRVLRELRRSRRRSQRLAARTTATPKGG